MSLDILEHIQYYLNIFFQDVNHDAKYFLLYYYYGGMIYTAVKNYDRALYFFEVAVSTPAMAMSHIMLEAYKKFILVSLIINGKVSAYPETHTEVTLFIPSVFV